ncbi:MAG: hypothetical protein V1921_06315 [Candidatus Altiarchaeota archaeon]
MALTRRTKVVKLKLEGGGEAERLPKLMEGDMKTCRKVFEAYDPHMGEGDYGDMLKATKGLNVDSKQLENILRDLHANYSQDRNFADGAGLLLSALVNNSEHDEFEIETPVPLNYVGTGLIEGKTLRIKGNVGDHAGDSMQGGTLNIKGNAGHSTGDGMHGGEINVTGFTRTFTGSNMNHGSINIGESAGAMTGAYMGGGVIVCKGSVFGLAHTIYGGRIYGQGKQVWPE